MTLKNAYDTLNIAQPFAHEKRKYFVMEGNMGKKIIALSIAVMMLGCVLTGCTKSTSTTDENKQSTSYTAVLPESVENADIYVEPVEGISDEFIRGVDISSLIAEENSGVVFYDEEGNASDLMKILADAGVNWIRVRVWNDPYNTQDVGYGGGNCDTENAAEIGRRAAEYGMKLLVDFHYSDFWADPSKQAAPKAWAHLTYADKVTAFYDFTVESLKTIIDAGADVGMVQIGNETNNGLAGETDWDRMCELMNQGCKAVRDVSEEYNSSIKIAVHYTNASDYNGIDGIAKKLQEHDVDYDVFGLSYYLFWHGTFENLENVMTNITENYGKEVMIAETSYVYTLEDGDGHPNSVGEDDLNSNYAATVQSQATALRDVMASIASIGEKGLGVFYWEPAWIPVNVYDVSASDEAEVLTENKNFWETYGSGWASSFASTYDKADAGVYFGGSAWDNQALFDFYGHPLPSLNVFKWVKYGTACELQIDYVNDVTLDVNVGSTLHMPTEIPVVYNDRNQNGNMTVTWDADQIAAIDTNVMQEYDVAGVLEDGTKVNCHVNVAFVNYVKNPSFEEKDTSMWNIIYDTENPADYQDKESDANTGTMSLHFWSTDEFSFAAEQTVTDLDSGSYYFSVYAQGGDVGKNAVLYAYVTTGGETYTQAFELTGWCKWVKVEIPEITVTDGTAIVGISVTAAAKGWGTIDDFYFCLTQ